MPYASPTMPTSGDTTRVASAEPSPGPSVTSTQISSYPRSHDTAWQHSLSSTFSQLSDQFKDASQAVSTLSIPHTTEEALASILERLGYIEQRQKNLDMEIRDLRENFSVAGSSERPANPTELEVLLKEHIALYKLDQERLHGRLQNALATKSLSPIKMLPMKNSKTPPNAPGTRGEFEHLTKERYEGLLTSYDLPVPLETAARREALGAFLGIPVAPLEKK